jgi:hypothetical protein
MPKTIFQILHNLVSPPLPRYEGVIVLLHPVCLDQQRALGMRLVRVLELDWEHLVLRSHDLADGDSRRTNWIVMVHGWIVSVQDIEPQVLVHFEDVVDLECCL